ncbi:hypothetical protein HD554DRAFT_742014 [Boletus coccyginus]|nr:hypothetical protein HD554DRAFT_742014 [Boletus coccyginus]
MIPLPNLQELFQWWHRLCPNLRAFFSSSLALAREPGRFLFLVVDCYLLLQSSVTWVRRQSGPDLVYPMLSIRKRQSGRLARLILEHCRAERFELPPRDNEDSTQVDLYGLTCLLMLFDICVCLFNWDRATWINFAGAIVFNLILCLYAVFREDGTLTLARRLDTSTLGCVVLLDQDFTVILNGG